MAAAPTVSDHVNGISLYRCSTNIGFFVTATAGSGGVNYAVFGSVSHALANALNRESRYLQLAAETGMILLC